jgi:hypothetical protein
VGRFGHLASLVTLWVAFLVMGMAIATPAAGEPPAGDCQLEVKTEDGVTTLSLAGQEPFHRTSNEVIEPRPIELADSPTCVVLWAELPPEASPQSYYAISLDGINMATVRETSYVIELRHRRFDPLLPVLDRGIAADLQANDATNLYLVQFWTQPLEEYRMAIQDAGGVLHKFLTNHAHYVRMTPEVRDSVSALPFVRWVGPVLPEYKLEREFEPPSASLARVASQRYSIMLNERGSEAQGRVVAALKILGAEVHGTTPLGFRVEATMSVDQVQTLAVLDDVMFIDRKGDLELDLDIVRQIGGADYVESVAGFTGQGVRAEVADSELDVTHPEWSAAPIIHISGGGVNHGTSVYGILFGRGADPQARGIIPDAVGIFAQSNTLLGGGLTRYTHTAELVDPLGPYRAVLQTNSTGDPRTFFYTTISAEMDDVIFINDITITQSQSNSGTQNSRPQAWAKNVVSGGAVQHFDTLSRADDSWSVGSGSIGPGADGRIKPDLSFFYDKTYSATRRPGSPPAGAATYTEFGGTSGATPSIAGYFGLFYQMWSEQVFGNAVPNPGGTVFENRPHMTTAKAAMINTATQYPFSGLAHDMTRVHQGWGMPSVRYLYDVRDKIGFIDETEVLQNLESVEFLPFVEPGEPELRVTMTYADPMGMPGAGVHRINDLTLKVTSPSSTVYWGNNGLLDGNFSSPGGSANTIDTVENVFIQNPEAGIWSVEVIASEINEDSHVETPEVDADFALIVSGANCCANEPPVADAGDDQLVEWAGGGGQVILDGSGSFDPDGDPLTFTWTGDFLEGGGVVNGEMVVVTFDDLGIFEVTLRVEDPFGLTDDDTVAITVEDTTPPEVACVETTNPSGRNVPKGRNADGFYELVADDDCDDAPVILVSDQAGSGPFGPFASGDRVKITEAPGGKPSAKPMGSSNGQAGAITAHLKLRSDATVTAIDASGNVGTAACLVPPPPK